MKINQLITVLLCFFTACYADPNLPKQKQPFSKAAVRKSKHERASFPIRPVLKLSPKYKEMRDIKVVAHLKNAISESFFQVPGYKTDTELFVDKQLIADCAERFNLKVGTFNLKAATIAKEQCIYLVKRKKL